MIFIECEGVGLEAERIEVEANADRELPGVSGRDHVAKSKFTLISKTEQHIQCHGLKIPEVGIE